MVSFQRKKSVSALKVGVKVTASVIALYASGFLLNIVGIVMTNTSSPFYTGLRLIGWTVGNSPAWNSSTDAGYSACTQGASAPLSATTANCLYATSGTGILSVIGLLAIVWIIFEFVDVRL